jgi:cytochrome c oxidase subunit II
MARSRIRALLRVSVLLAVVVLASACAMVPAPPHTTQAKEVFGLFNIVLVMGGIVFVGVEGFILYAIVRYRRRDDRLPTQIHGNNMIEVIWTAIPTVIVLILFVLSTFTLNSISAHSDNPGVTIEVDAFQWQWTFHYLDSDADPTNDVSITGDAANPPQMVLPVGKPIKLILVSKDVIHSFYVPAFLVKRDVIPLPEGRSPNELEFTVSEAGTYSGQCAEFCGDLHSKMTFTVRAVSSADYDTWLAAIRSGQTPQPSAPAGSTVVKISAKNVAFSTDKLEAPANQPFSIEFTNNDPFAHNIAIGTGGTNYLFDGAYYTGPGTTTYVVGPLPAGTYTFLCKIHPAMTGTLTVK